jgi:hypothetical protein
MEANNVFCPGNCISSVVHFRLTTLTAVFSKDKGNSIYSGVGKNDGSVNLDGSELKWRWNQGIFRLAMTDNGFYIREEWEKTYQG